MEFLFVTGDLGVMNHVQTGGAVRSTLMIEALSRLGHVDVISFFDDSTESTIPNCDVLFSETISAMSPSVKDRVLFNLRLFFTPWSPEAYAYVNKRRVAVVSRFLKEKHYDYIVCHLVYDAITCGLIKYPRRLIIDVDDNMVSVIRRTYADVQFESFFSRMRAHMRLRAVGMMQHWLLRRVKLSFYSNYLEPPYEKSVFLHNVPLLSSACDDVTERTPMRLLFVGHIDFFPNREGIAHFVESIFPLICERIPTVELNIVGKCMDQDFRERLSLVKGVHVIGFVDDLQKTYQDSRAVVVPLYYGAGTSIKFIEAVMMNRPIVSTPVGVRGFDTAFFAGQHYLEARSDQEFVDQVVKLLSSTDDANKMASAANQIAQTKFSKESFFSIVKRSIV